MQFVDNEVAECGRPPVPGPPRVGVRRAQDAVAVEVGGVFVSSRAVGILLPAAVALAHHEELVAVAVACSRNEPCPVAAVLAHQHVAVVRDPVHAAAQVADDMHGTGFFCPGPEGRTLTGDEVAAERHARKNVALREGHCAGTYAPKVPYIGVYHAARFSRLPAGASCCTDWLVGDEGQAKQGRGLHIQILDAAVSSRASVG